MSQDNNKEDDDEIELHPLVESSASDSSSSLSSKETDNHVNHAEPLDNTPSSTIISRTGSPALIVASVTVISLFLYIKSSFLSNHHWPLLRSQDQAFPSCNCASSKSPTISDNNNSNNNKFCCERIIFRTHKFGTILLGDLFASFRQSHTIQTQPTPQSSHYTLPDNDTHYNDYRHVLVTRNWYDAVVSGYLYHKAGYECWMEYNGRNDTFHSKYFDMEVHYHNKFWDTQHLTFHKLYNMSYPPRNNRSLCLYLAQEAEQDGIKVIMDVALSRWYKGVVSYYQKAKEHDDNQIRIGQPQKSLFLCYEDLVDPLQQEQIYYQILKFMFPGVVHTNQFPTMPGKMKQLLHQQNNSVYAGGHASTKDPELRARLRDLVIQYDHEFFQNVFFTSNALFGCGSSKE